MTPTLASDEATPSTPQTASAIYIQQPRLVVTLRILWLVFTLTTISLFVASIPVASEKVTTLCNGADCSILQMTAQGKATLDSAGISIQLYLAVIVITEAVLLSVFIAVGSMIFWRRPLDIVVVLFTFLSVTWMPLFLPTTIHLGESSAFWNLVKIFQESMGYICGAAFILVFPDGRFLPRWTRWYFLGFALALPLLILPNEGLFRVFFQFWDTRDVRIEFYFVFMLFGSINVIVQLWRYRHYSTPLQRQQTKWVLIGLSIFVVIGGSVLAASITLFPEVTNPLNPVNVWYVLFAVVVTSTLLIFSPLTVMFSILRYRLWDVDVVLNRSLVYGGLTLLLAVVFAGIVAVISALTQGQAAGIGAIVAAVIATALFNPTRKRLQSFVDRRIYHLNFDLNQLAAAQKSPDIKNAGALSGRKLDGYDVLDVIGKGGMGEVYKGQANGQTVALKILPDELAKQEDFRKRFEREGQALTALQHPNIVRMIGSGSSDGVAYLAMEYLDGDDLSWKLKLQGALSLEETRDILSGLCSALDYAHQHGFIHRDIKPSNVMLRRGKDGETLEAVLMDFGVTKVHEAQTAITGTGGIGTIGYMAPEQIMAAKEVDARADIYALGVMAYEMLTGELPFKGSPAQVMFAHLQQPPPDPRDVQDELPSTTAHALLRALAKQPDERFASAGEFAAALG